MVSQRVTAQIGFFPTTIRIWFRVRLVTVKIWEKQNEMPSVYGGAGMGAQKAAFQISLTAEVAALDKFRGHFGLSRFGSKLFRYKFPPLHRLIMIASRPALLF